MSKGDATLLGSTLSAVESAREHGGELAALAELALTLAGEIEMGGAVNAPALAKELRATLERIGVLKDGDSASAGLADQLGRAD